MELKVIDLNHGLGGRMYGFQKAGFQVAYAIDKDELNHHYCQLLCEMSECYLDDIIEIDPEELPDAEVIMYKYLKETNALQKMGKIESIRSANRAFLEILGRKKNKVFVVEYPPIMSRDSFFCEFKEKCESLGYVLSAKIYEEAKVSGYPIVGRQAYLIGVRKELKTEVFLPEIDNEGMREIQYEKPEMIASRYRKSEEPRMAEWPFLIYERGTYHGSDRIHMGGFRENYVIDSLGLRRLTPNELAQTKGLTGVDYNDANNIREMYRRLSYASDVYISQLIAEEIKQQVFENDELDDILSAASDYLEQHYAGRENTIIDEIKVEKGFYSVFELKRKNDSKDPRIVLDSSFQRNNVWNNARNSELVESVLMGLPLPIFYFNQDRYGKLIVVDGRQRLTALFKYMDNKYALRDLKVLKQYNGRKFRDLDPVMMGKIEDYQISAHVILPPTPEWVKYNVFDRVNRGGIQLNKQEIRNALYQGKATELLKRIIESDSFARATGNAFLHEKRMKDKYLVTRYLTMQLYLDGEIQDDYGERYAYRGDIDDFLAHGMECLNAMEDSKLHRYEKMTENALENSYRYMGPDAFRMKREGIRTPINMNLFETLMIALSGIGENHNSSEVIRRINDLVESKEYRENLVSRRDGGAQLLWRLNAAQSLRKEIEKC